MYTLVSAPVLGFDLARLHGGERIAGVLGRALTMTAADLDVLASFARYGADRADDWTVVESATRQRHSVQDALLTVTTLFGARAAGEETDRLTAPALDLLERVPLGTLDGLLTCLRDEIVPAAGDAERRALATSVLADAVASAYVHDLPDTLRRRLAAPWVAASRRLPAGGADLGPQATRVEAMLARARVLVPADLRRMQAVMDTWRASGESWAAAVHDTAWAVHLQNRVTAAAAAQFLLVEAVRAGGVPAALLARGGWNLLSGAVAGLVVADLLSAELLARLLTPYVEALGPGFLA